MNKRPSLSENMKALTQEDASDFFNSGKSSLSMSKTSNRDGMKKILTPVDPEFHKKIKILAVRMELTLEELVREALSDYAKKHSAF